MPLFASGSGTFGTIGGLGKGGGVLAKPAVGNSKMMPAQSISQVVSVAKEHTQNFVANARQVNKGATGNSRISIKA